VKEKELINSYSSAESGFPVKIILNENVMSMIRSKRLLPVTVNLNPTNICNLNCSFCSCKKRDRSKSLSIDRIIWFFEQFDSIQSCIITGGGEPLLYDKFSEVIDFLNNRNISIGLVTNGILFDSINTETIEKIKWSRVSLSNKSLETGILDVIERTMERSKNIKWSFNFVCGETNEKNIEVFRSFYIKFSNKINHFMVVDDLYIMDERVNSLKIAVEQMNIDRSKIIYRTRQKHVPGNKKCYIAMLKPNISAEGDIYPCCGVQYAMKDSFGNRNYDERLSMGKIEEAKHIWSNNFFDGSCDVCYYDKYNKLIDNIFSDVDDLEFI